MILFHFKWRQEYAPDILADIRELLDKMLARTDILPKSDLAEAVGYLDMEWDAVVDIFKRGDTNLDKGGTAMLITSWRVPPRREDEPLFLHVQTELAVLRIALRSRACRCALYAGPVF